MGIPTVIDRLLQQAVLQVINARYEYEFLDSNFGFRPNKNVQQAVLKAQGYINEGFQYIVDIDLIPMAIGTIKLTIAICCNCFTVKSNVVKPYALSLPLPAGRRKWLRSPIQINGKLVKRRKGVPQSLSRLFWRE